MSNIKVQGNVSGTGTLTISAPNTNTDRTLTLPDNTGTLVSTGSTAGVSQAMLASGVAGNGPAFSAYMNANQTLSNQTTTKIQYNTEEYDTASCYDVSTYRFLPLVAGYYSFTAAVQMANSCAVVLYVSKNGSPVKSVSTTVTGTNSNTMTATVYLNGSTDYVEMYCYQSSGGNLGILGTAQWSFFQGVLVRAA